MSFFNEVNTNWYFYILDNALLTKYNRNMSSATLITDSILSSLKEQKIIESVVRRIKIKRTDAQIKNAEAAVGIVPTTYSTRLLSPELIPMTSVIDDFQKQLSENIIKDMDHKILAGRRPEPAHIKKYPITNSIWVRGDPRSGNEIPAEVHKSSNQCKADIDERERTGRAMYYVQLRDLRDASGNCFDPWMRNMCKHPQKFLKGISPYRADLLVHANSMEQLFVWIFDTTIDGEILSLVVWEVCRIAYARESVKNVFIELLNPLRVSPNPQYEMPLVKVP